ncbi:MAG TPA: hypothetical protein VE442_21405 [Jatrophihabitans sp.]|nr:hypothetical protein [Jatrophihabitans sp.]
MLFVAAVVVAAALIVQNPATVTVHAFNQSWNVDMRWLFVAGLALTAIALLGLGMMRLGDARYARLRRERRALKSENKRLTRAAEAEPGAASTPPRRRWRSGQQPVSTAPSSPRRSLRDRLVPRKQPVAHGE